MFKIISHFQRVLTKQRGKQKPPLNLVLTTAVRDGYQAATLLPLIHGELPRGSLYTLVSALCACGSARSSVHYMHAVPLETGREH